MTPELRNLGVGLVSAAGRAIYEELNGARTPDQLDAVARLIWEGYGAGRISDGEATELSGCIERRRPLGRHTAPGHARPLGPLRGRLLSHFVPRQPPRSPDRKASRDRRRTLGGSSALPPDLRLYYTEGQRSVLCVLGGEVKRQGFCNRPLDQIGALAGVCRTTVQTTMHEARRLGHIKFTERPRRGRKSLTNLVEMVSPEWRAWLKRGPSAARRIGSNPVKMVSTTKSREIENKNKETKKRACEEGSSRSEPHGPPDGLDWRTA